MFDIMANLASTAHQLFFLKVFFFSYQNQKVCIEKEGTSVGMNGMIWSNVHFAKYNKTTPVSLTV